MRLSHRSVLLTTLLVTLCPACSPTLVGTPNFEPMARSFGKSEHQPSVKKLSVHKDYAFRGTMVRFQSSPAPSVDLPWVGLGTDGTQPREILTEVLIKSEFGEYKLPPSLLIDLGEPNIWESGEHEYVRINRHKNTLRIAMSNGDGAGSYEVLFVADIQRGRVQRYIRDYLESDLTITHGWMSLDKRGG
jgi:hypothetical protein